MDDDERFSDGAEAAAFRRAIFDVDKAELADAVGSNIIWVRRLFIWWTNINALFGEMYRLNTIFSLSPGSHFGDDASPQLY